MKKWILILLLTFLCPLKVFSYKYEIAIVSMFKNEAKWLKEWIEYHRLIGVEKFYLYDNDSTDDFEEVLKPYIKQGIVSYIPWHTGIAPYTDPGSIPKHTGYQWTAFKDCVNKSKGKVKWLGILDTDEFINTKNDKSGLKKILKKYENTNVALVAFKWRCFGTGELWDIPKGALLTELIYKRAADEYRSHKLTKYFVRPEVSIFPRCHGSSLEKGYTSKNYDKIQINHYQYRGRKEAINKRMRLHIENEEDMLLLNQSQMDTLKNIELTYHEIEDRSIYPSLKSLKQAMRK